MSTRRVDEVPNRFSSGTSSSIDPDVVVNMTNEEISSISRTTNETTWLNIFARCDEIMSGSLLHLCYRLIDIIILLIGLFSRQSTCLLSHRLVVTSICLLIFYFIDLTIIFHFFVRHVNGHYRDLTEEEKSEQLRRTSSFRGFFIVIKLIPVCFGTSYALTSTISERNDCELIRFCVGVVCLSTLLILIIPPTKPVIPTRRSFVMEFVVLSFLLIINGIYFGTVLSAMSKSIKSSCVVENSADIYLRAPLKSYGQVGLIIFGFITTIHILNLLISQICFRLTNGRQLYIYYYSFQYMLNYLSGIIVVYYFSVGCLFLFQPRSGEPCRSDSPQLYRTLIIWQWLRILTPLVAVPFILILCCLGVFFGIILSYCLPASITVPLLELLRGWLSTAPVQINANPPATQANIDAIPLVLFGQQPDKFNQTECAICQTNFEANESIKKLDCGHLFHSNCVANWLLITRICPICRQRMGITNQ